MRVIRGDARPRPVDWGYLNPNGIKTKDWQAFGAACDAFGAAPVPDGGVELSLAVSNLIEVIEIVANEPSLRIVRGPLTEAT